MIDLSGKVFVITGGNGGIGLGMAEGIVMSGGSIVIWGRNQEKNAAAVETLEALGGRAAAFVCDVADEEQVIATMAQSVETFGRLDGLFANAGRGGPGTAFVDTSLEDWRAVMATNLDGVFLTLREAAKVLIDQGEGGSLVAVSSMADIGRNVVAARAHYDHLICTSCGTVTEFSRPELEPMQLAVAANIDVHETDLSLFDAYNADEMFLTSTSLCLCPVRSINGTRTKDAGIPGPVTARLTDAFRDLVEFDFVDQYLQHLRD